MCLSLINIDRILIVSLLRDINIIFIDKIYCTNTQNISEYPLCKKIYFSQLQSQSKY